MLDTHSLCAVSIECWQLIWSMGLITSLVPLRISSACTTQPHVSASGFLSLGLGSSFPFVNVFLPPIPSRFSWSFASIFLFFVEMLAIGGTAGCRPRALPFCSRTHREAPMHWLRKCGSSDLVHHVPSVPQLYRLPSCRLGMLFVGM